MSFENFKKIYTAVAYLVVSTFVIAPLFALWFHFHPGEDHPEINGENVHSHLLTSTNQSSEQKTAKHHDSDQDNQRSSGFHLIKNTGGTLYDGVITNNHNSQTHCFVKLPTTNNYTNDTPSSAITDFYLKFPIYSYQALFVLSATDLSPPAV